MKRGLTELQLHAKTVGGRIQEPTGLLSSLADFGMLLRFTHARIKRRKRRGEEVKVGLYGRNRQPSSSPSPAPAASVHFPTGAEVNAPESGVRLKRLRMEPRGVEAAPHTAKNERVRGDGATAGTPTAPARASARAHCCPQLQVLHRSRPYLDFSWF